MVKPTFKKVQVVYYVSKNGELEHPHIVEVTHLVHNHLRLKDVLERLSVLRGRGMPSLYSWSCKRMYKNGYVWNDLGENDIILPSEAQEYVLKASQLVLNSPDKHMHVEEAQMMNNNIIPKRKPLTPKQGFSEQELDFEEKRMTPSRCSKATTLSPPLSLSTPSASKRFEDGDPYPTLSRNSVLFQLMACGGGSIGKSSSPNTSARKSCSLHKEALCKAVAVEDEICCMSENPRFGNMQAEEREYFSGSMVETMTGERGEVEAVLNKSSSYTEQRGSKTTLLMVAAEEDDDMKTEKRIAGKCIPKRFC
ncbi:hypothetical protein QVD17_19036 [Tagetes erecta]|uniref:SOSEKI DIX-like domain-containing protein n=1 Tax=Tagetes erecta TaxID=13708 RepID=A0AAD8KLK8_TARER|nr:hypothetical protein QVD17_19036 [Tagetes erecta]